MSFPLDRQPVPGWELSAADLGLPPGVHLGDLFASNGDKAYFITGEKCNKDCATPTGWLYGLDTGTGTRLFPPLPLSGYYFGTGKCVGNGPAVAVCTTHTIKGAEERFPPTAWVIDLDRGTVTASGPNNLDPVNGDGEQGAIDVVGGNLGGTYAVVTVRDKGVYGIGPRAERTWFIPGSGQLRNPDHLSGSDIAPLRLAVQSPGGNPPSSDGRYRVFSVVDGKDLTPAGPAGAELEQAVVYSGGFAYQFQQRGSAGTLIYDTTGREVGRQEPERSFPQQNAAMLTIMVGAKFQIYTAAGKPVVEIPARDTIGEFQTIGTKVYVKTPNTRGRGESWQSWDLLNGQPGPTCTMQLGVSYVGSDGSVVLSENSFGSTEFVAIDTKNCRTLWEMTGHIRLFKVGKGLVEVDNDHDTVLSLRPPG